MVVATPLIFIWVRSYIFISGFVFLQVKTTCKQGFADLLGNNNLRAGKGFYAIYLYVLNFCIT
ncbi:hypothetical protein RhiirC2_755044 [Rhizophagus irregularis]|uniref:Uncharacterized protein n=1 Tax=Rhizophagus irregularis TaxID=588596 RepID=A0A2N1MUX8_9GLOM|nr:hypothetical protein RhiirC2_755044 [Rhizophagus irregularis]